MQAGPPASRRRRTACRRRTRWRRGRRCRTSWGERTLTAASASRAPRARARRAPSVIVTGVPPERAQQRKNSSSIASSSVTERLVRAMRAAPRHELARVEHHHGGAAPVLGSRQPGSAQIRRRLVREGAQPDRLRPAASAVKDLYERCERDGSGTPRWSAGDAAPSGWTASPSPATRRDPGRRSRRSGTAQPGDDESQGGDLRRPLRRARRRAASPTSRPRSRGRRGSAPSTRSSRSAPRGSTVALSPGSPRSVPSAPRAWRAPDCRAGSWGTRGRHR